MIPTPTPALSIYPETWQRTNELLNQTIGFGLDEIAIGFTLLVVLGFFVIWLIRRVRTI